MTSTVGAVSARSPHFPQAVSCLTEIAMITSFAAPTLLSPGTEMPAAEFRAAMELVASLGRQLRGMWLEHNVTAVHCGAAFSSP